MKLIYLYFLVISVFCGSFYSAAQTLPSLGAASSFAILGATTVTGTAIDTVFGNIGVSPGTSVTGFPPGFVENGKIYTGAGSLASEAQKSALTMYNYLVSQPYPAANDLSGYVLGVSPAANHLKPGVYHFSSSVGVSDTLFLDDGGDRKAVYIFQVGSTVISTAAAVVIMSSGGSGVNVYWQIGSSATFGVNTSFLGNLLAYTSITMNDGAYTSGRVFALNGATTISGSYVDAGGKSWSGKAGNHKWSDPNNWHTYGVPGDSDNVNLYGADSININMAAKTKGLLLNNPKIIMTIQPGFSLTVGDQLTMNFGILKNNSSLILLGGLADSAGSITNNGTVEFHRSVPEIIPAGVFTNNLTNNISLYDSAGVSLAGPLGITGQLLVSSGQFNTGDFLTLASNALQTGLINGTGTGSVAGNITMQRYLGVAYGYKYFSSPCQNATVSNFSGTVNLHETFPNFYKYTENQNYYGFVTDTAGSNPLIPLVGYAADMGTSTSPATVSITGIANNGPATLDIYNHNQPYTQGFNLVGNPYPSPINWDATGGWNRENIDNAVYFFESGTTSQYTGTYSSYVNGVSSNGVADNIIASMQGFFVHVTNGKYPVAGKFSITNGARVNDLSPVFHKTSIYRTANIL